MNDSPGINEKGSVLLVALFVMLAVTLIGMMASKSTVVESKITANQKKFDEKFANAEAALNLAVRTFRNLPDTEEYMISTLLNDTRFPDAGTAVYSNDSTITFPGTDLPIAKIEIRRIIKTPDLDGDGEPDGLDTALSDQADNLPDLSHRYYAGSIDRKRFAITVTAYEKNSGILSNTWVQKGVDLPSKQDSDLF